MAEAEVVVITGGSAGIGAALARRLASDGKRLVLAARRRSELDKVAGEARERGAGGTLVVETDVTRRSDVFGLRDATLSTFGHIDVWVNNAGQGIARPVLELSDEDVDLMMAVNLKSALYGMQAAVPHFLERARGHLVNISSFLGRVPLVSVRSAYSAAKAALNSLTTNLRMEVSAHPGIHVSLVMPGIVRTDFARNARGAAHAAPAAAAATSPGGSAAPQMPAQSAEEVAEAIAGLLRQPAPELYTNPATPELVRRYFAGAGVPGAGRP